MGSYKIEDDSSFYAPLPDAALRPEALRLAHRISLEVVATGAIFAIIVQLILYILGRALGMVPLDATIGVVDGLYLGISSLLASFVGGYSAARLLGKRGRASLLHGFLTWGLSLIISAFLLATPIGPILGGSSAVMTTVASEATTPVSIDLPTEEGVRVSDDVQALVAAHQPKTPEAAQELERLRLELLDAPEDRSKKRALVDKIHEQTNLGRPQAGTLVDNWIYRHQTGEAQVFSVTPEKPQSGASWALLLLLAFSALAAIAGGAAGSPRADVVVLE